MVISFRPKPNASSQFAVRAALSLLCLGVPGLASAQDSDGDGTADVIDAFPCDDTAQGVAYVPAQGIWGQLMFEDQWPSSGDSDYNDTVLSHHTEARLNGSGQVLSLSLQLELLAVGGNYDNGLGLQVGALAGSASAIRVSLNGGPAVNVAPSALDANLTIDIVNDLRSLLGGQSGQINSRSDLGRQPGAQITVEIDFGTPQSIVLSDSPFDLFLFRSADRTHEIHRTNYAGTAAMDSTRFGTADDASSPGRSFVDIDGLPFVLELPQVANYPAEGVAVSALYPDILGFAASAGVSNQDFYASTVVSSFGYQDSTGQGAIVPSVLTQTVPDTSCVGNPAFAGLMLWLDGDDVDADGVAEGLGESTLSGTAITQWRDKSGRGYHMNPRNALATLLVNAQNGRSTPSFDKTQIYERLTGLNLGDYSLFVVMQRVTWNGEIRREVVATGEDFADRFPLDWSVTAGRVEHQRGGAAGTVVTGQSTVNWTGFRKIAFTQERLSNTSVRVRYWQDGSIINSNTGNYENLDNEIWVGGKVRQDVDSNRWNGEIAEVLMYDRTLAASEMAYVQAYLQAKWSLP